MDLVRVPQWAHLSPVGRSAVGGKQNKPVAECGGGRILLE